MSTGFQYDGRAGGLSSFSLYREMYCQAGQKLLEYDFCNCLRGMHTVPGVIGNATYGYT